MTENTTIPEPPPPDRSKPSTLRKVAWPIATGVALLVGIGIGSASTDDGESNDATSLQAEIDNLEAERDRIQEERDELLAQLDDASDESTDDEDDADAATDGSDENNAADDSSAEPGTRDNPFEIGDVVDGEEWEITLDQPYEAWEDIQAENEFNEPPPDGMEFHIVPVDVTYLGDETGLPWVELDFTFVGDDNRTYTDRCGVIPNDLSDVDELYADGTAEGNVCITVPEGASGLWTVATFWSDPVFFDAS